jgi:hypothetical protein
MYADYLRRAQPYVREIAVETSLPLRTAPPALAEGLEHPVIESVLPAVNTGYRRDQRPGARRGVRV